MIFLTGSTGFVGRHAAAALLQAGHQIRALVRPGSEAPAGVIAVRGALEHPESYDEALAGVDTVVHLASKSIDLDGSGFHGVNVEGTRHLVEAAARRGVRRFLLLSSTGVYGHTSLLDVAEDQPLAPDTPLSRSRSEAERLVLERQREFEATILRPRFIHGPGDRHFLPRFAAAARRFRMLPVSGRARLSVIHAADLAAVVARLCAPGPGRPAAIYHVNDGQPHTVASVLGAVASAVGVRAPLFVPVPFAALYLPARAYEVLSGKSPEDPSRSVTSLRLKFLAQHSSFSNRGLLSRFPDLSFRPLEGDPWTG